MKTSNKKTGPAVAAPEGNPLAIYNYPIVPEESTLPRKAVPPVTRRDLGAGFRNAMYFPLLKSDVARQVFRDARLGSATWTNWHGNVEVREAGEDPSKLGESVPDWEAVAALHAKHGLFVMFNSWAGDRISKKHHERMLELFGPQFIGHDEGEWDGAYIAYILYKETHREGIANEWRRTLGCSFDLSPKRSRKEACRHYLDWLGKTYAAHQNYMFTTSSLLFGCHYAGEMGTRLLGLELGERLPSDSLMLSFCRGACRQYDLLFATFPSVFSIRGSELGLKVYPRQGQPQSVAEGDVVMGPEHGTTLGLLKREWWCSYMSGAALIGLQFGYFPVDLEKFESAANSLPVSEPVTLNKVKAHFTPLGWLFWECKQTAIRHPLRGVPYTPVAVMLHHDHGWYPHPNIYAEGKPDCVWANIPYNRGDWQTELFFQWVYPGYQASCADKEARDERGKIVNTPFGDSFDVILSNAPSSGLEKYRAVILLGSWDVAADPQTQRRLERFVRAGGTVIADRSQWKTLPKDAVKQPEAAGAVAAYACGAGRIVMVSEPAWGAGPDDDGAFRRVTAQLEDYVREYGLVEVEGRPIYYLVNVTDRPAELLVTLCNNSHTLPWEGTIRIKGQVVAEVEEWLAFGETDIRDGALRCGVPANDARIFRLRTAQPFLNLRFRNVPWKKMGYGVPE